jgi:hypothetical protein
MKKITLYTAFLFIGCSSAAEPAQEEIKTVDWYKANKEAMTAKIKECEANPGQLRSTPSCINAGTAKSQLTFEKRGGITFDEAPAKP